MCKQAHLKHSTSMITRASICAAVHHISTHVMLEPQQVTHAASRTHQHNQQHQDRHHGVVKVCMQYA